MRRMLGLMLVLALVAAAVGVCAGSSGWGLATPEILWNIRVPRVLAGFGAGAALALSGALMQLLTRNPLADPYVLGLSGGASVGALLVLWVGTLGGMVLVPASDLQLRGMVFWLLGDLNGATQWGVAWLAWLLALALVWPTARQLDWLARGDAWAATLGVPVARRRRTALAAAALATGAAVATAGAIGFVGLVVPHALRLLGARPAAMLLPASALGGGAFVVLADAAARTLVAPVQLPVGVIAAAVGVPSFLALLLQGGYRRKR